MQEEKLEKLFENLKISDVSEYFDDTVCRIVGIYQKLTPSESAVENFFTKFKPVFESAPKLRFIFNILEIIKLLKVKVSGFGSSSLREIHKEVYEGGFMLWECERDATQYLQKFQEYVKPAGWNVLEIGSGAGIVGIKLLQMGASKVTFQDFNEEVLQYWTIPNLLLNYSPLEISQKCKFVKGSWADFDKESQVSHFVKQQPESSQKYDLIVGCDIIYETKNYQTLLDLFAKHLSPTGRVIIASKAYYYGNGGICI